MLITLVTGTRPNLVKAAPLLREFEKQEINCHWVHTGQHKDKEMFLHQLRDLCMRDPETLFKSYTYPTTIDRISHIMKSFQGYCEIHNPNLVIVLGDVDSTLAAALVANKLKIPLAHVEAGERSYNRSMPEEINRILVDNMSQYLFCASRFARINLQGEGLFQKEGIHVYYTGNLMIDQLKYFIDSNKSYAIRNEDYVVLTLHRQENVDIGQNLDHLIEMVGKVSKQLIVYFPVHPRTKKRLSKMESRFPNLILTDPMPYSDFITLVNFAEFVMTDSGGIQVETSYMNIPCLTLRNETEWPDTVMSGTNHLVNVIDDEDLLFCVGKIMAGEWKESSFRETDLCKMNAAENITNIIKSIRS